MKCPQLIEMTTKKDGKVMGYEFSIPIKVQYSQVSKHWMASFDAVNREAFQDGHYVGSGDSLWEAMNSLFKHIPDHYFRLEDGYVTKRRMILTRIINRIPLLRRIGFLWNIDGEGKI